MWNIVIHLGAGRIYFAVTAGQEKKKKKPDENSKSMGKNPLGKLRESQLMKKSTSFYGTRMFATVITRARHLSMSETR